MHHNYKNISLTLFTIVASYTLPIQEINTTDVTFTSHASPSTRAHRKNTALQEEQQKKSHKVITDMNYDELLEAKERYNTANNTTGYTKVLELLVKLAEDTTALAEHMIELADAYYEQGYFKKASIVYNEFISFYKGHKDIEYIYFKTIMSLEQLLLPADRDQTRTEEILAFIESYIVNEHFMQYRDQVVVLQKKCRLLLFESKKNTCQFYITYDNTTAATTCIARLRDEWIAILPEVEKDILTLELALAEKTNNSDLMQEKQALLDTKFPEQTITVVKNTHTRTMQDRF